VSATPEQIAERLEALFGGMWLSPLHPHDTATCRAAASLIRAQSERERVLVEALRGLLSQTRSNQAPNGQKAVQAARAAIHGETP